MFVSADSGNLIIQKREKRVKKFSVFHCLENLLRLILNQRSPQSVSLNCSLNGVGVGCAVRQWRWAGAR